MINTIDDPAGELEEDESYADRETKNLKILSIAKSMASQRPDAPIEPFNPADVEATLKSLEDDSEGDNASTTGGGGRKRKRPNRARISNGFELDEERVITEDAELSPEEQAAFKKKVD